MSRSLFDDFPELSSKKRETYTPAELNAYSELFDEIKLYWENTYMKNVFLSYGEKVEDLDCIITNYVQEDIDPRQFLDAVVLEASAKGASSFMLTELMSPMLQALYNRGHNDFVIDFALYSLDRPVLATTLAHDLKAEPDRRLKAMFLGIDVTMFAQYVENCDLVLDGEVYHLGNDSTDSKFTVTKQVHLVPLGQWASGCEFRLYQPDYCESMLSEYILGELQPEEPALKFLENHGFWKRNNTLYVPDDSEEWSEVLPR